MHAVARQKCEMHRLPQKPNKMFVKSFVACIEELTNLLSDFPKETDKDKDQDREIGVLAVAGACYIPFQAA